MDLWVWIYGMDWWVFIILKPTTEWILTILQTEIFSHNGTHNACWLIVVTSLPLIISNRYYQSIRHWALDDVHLQPMSKSDRMTKLKADDVWIHLVDKRSTSILTNEFIRYSREFTMYSLLKYSWYMNYRNGIRNIINGTEILSNNGLIWYWVKKNKIVPPKTVE